MEEDEEEKQSEIKESLKEMLSRIDANLMEIDPEIKGIDNPLSMDVDGTEYENSREEQENENETSRNLGQSESATPQATDTSSDKSIEPAENPYQGRSECPIGGDMDTGY
ncbi:hypothetical protein N7472_004167 [Penicillium cf. griseofulvum]|uniref:Uncharacterized protein n=1 Tax=Penicillium cf. griseofulvum TaxID=2972120 RepID=A0A9W9JL81_9EURO|nr:hypothetical protein N7472_004167 [Penicillium cf. griseofulvum]